MSRKVFTAGEVLAAADVNSFLMDQTVMSFAGTAARGSAIPTPVTGMTTYLEDTKDLRTYDGSAYISTAGLTLIRTQEFTSQSTVTFDNVFTSEFRNYKVIINAIGSTATTLVARMRSGGSTISTTTYSYQVFDATNTTFFGARVTGATFLSINSIRTSRPSLSDVTIGNPEVASATVFISNGYYDTALNLLYGENTNATSYDGVQFLPVDGTTTGQISIYGMKK